MLQRGDPDLPRRATQCHRCRPWPAGAASALHWNHWTTTVPYLRYLTTVLPSPTNIYGIP